MGQFILNGRNYSGITYAQGVFIDTEKEAVSRLYSEFAYATAGGSGIAKIVGEIIDDEGHVMRCDRYGSEPVRPVESEVSE